MLTEIRMSHHFYLVCRGEHLAQQGGPYLHNTSCTTYALICEIYIQNCALQCKVVQRPMQLNLILTATFVRKTKPIGKVT